jgi:hypothetical protein
MFIAAAARSTAAGKPLAALVEPRGAVALIDFFKPDSRSKRYHRERSNSKRWFSSHHCRSVALIV